MSRRLVTFLLCNKPEVVIFGTEETFRREEAGGYAPNRLTVGAAARLVAEGWDMWVDAGPYQPYIRFDSPAVLRPEPEPKDSETDQSSDVSALNSNIGEDRLREAYDLQEALELGRR